MPSNRSYTIKYSKEMRTETAAFIIESGRSEINLAEERGIHDNILRDGVPWLSYRWS